MHSSERQSPLKMLVPWLFLLSTIVTCNCYNTASPYTECQSTSQCGPGKCCVIVKGRFDTTSCQALRKLGEECRPPSDQAVDTTLNFPGGTSVAITDAHESLCPCEPGAACVRGYCVSK